MELIRYLTFRGWKLKPKHITIILQFYNCLHLSEKVNIITTKEKGQASLVSSRKSLTFARKMVVVQAAAFFCF